MINQPNGRTPNAIDQIARYFDVFIAPKSTFACIALDPACGWALLAYTLALGLATVLQQPAADRVTYEFLVSHSAGTPAVQTSTPTILAVLGAWAAGLLGLLLSTWLYLLASTVAGRGWDFARAWAVSVYSSAIAALTVLTNSVILVIRGTGVVHHYTDLFAIPALSVITSDPRLASGLAVFNPMNVWYYFDVVVALTVVLGVRLPVAIAVTMVISLATAAMYYGVAATYGVIT
jgi:hypothetical protein